MASIFGFIKEWGAFIIEKEMMLLGYLWKSITMMNFIYLSALVILMLYIYLKWEQGYFERRGIKSLPLQIPFIGHASRIFSGKEHAKDMIQRNYNAFPGEKYVGIRQFNSAMILIKDLDLVKQLTVTDFDHFVDHQLVVDEKADSIFGGHLFSLTGDKWRDMRATLSPAFTILKMRNMFPFITETSEQMVEYFQEKMNQSEFKERGLIEVELKEEFSKYSSDVIGSTAFGLKVNSFKDPDNEFYSKGMSVVVLGAYRQIKAMICLTFPILLKWKILSWVDENVKNFFRNLVWNTMREREEKKIVRPDMIQLLKEAKMGTLKYEASENENSEIGFATVEESHVGKRIVRRDWSDDEIVAQAVLFFFASFQITATVFSLMMCELAAHPDIQKKVQQEIDEIMTKKGNKKLEYDDIIKLKYMDMVISETLRMWPSLTFLDRNCVKPYQLPPSSGSGEGYTMKVGEGIAIPLYAFHHDPKYFPNPSKFDPERFSDENKHNIVPMSYMPFGLGPRNCIGNKFALMETKVMLFYLLSNFDFVQTAKSAYPVPIKKGVFHFIPEDGFWVGIKPRSF